MNKNLILSSLSCLLVLACASTEKKAAPATSAEAPASEAAASSAAAAPKAATTDGRVLVRGEPLTLPPESAVTLAEIEKDPEAFTGKRVRVEGRVEKVCQKKGCWLALTDDSGAEPVRVVMKDHAFFVPTDCVGKSVAVEGSVELREVSVEEQAHLAKDEGQEVDASTLKPRREVSIVATGVELRS